MKDNIVCRRTLVHHTSFGCLHCLSAPDGKEAERNADCETII